MLPQVTLEESYPLEPISGGDFLAEQSPQLFSDDIRLRIIDVSTRDDGSTSWTQDLLHDVGAVRTKISASAKPKVRIISIHSEGTIFPLQITRSLMQDILSTYNVSSDFCPVLRSFGEAPHLAEGSSSNCAIEALNNSREYRISYQIRYREENFRGGSNPWSLRQTGVYHHHTDDHDLFILLNSTQDSAFEMRILQLLKQDTERTQLCQNLFRMHVLLFSTYMEQWRWYFRHLGAQFEKKNDRAMTMKPRTAGSATLSFELVQSLRNLHDNVLSSKASCCGDLDVLKSLYESCHPLRDVYGLQPLKNKLRGYLESLEVLQSRIQNATDLSGYALDYSLAKSTFDSSLSVTIITFVSAFYLPGSFVGTLYGMNFFLYDQNSRTIDIAADFWIFLLTWLGLSLITGGIYIVWSVSMRNTTPKPDKKRERNSWSKRLEKFRLH